MSSSMHQETLALSPELAAKMEKLGITRVPADHFYVGGFRYTQFKDPIAQAERQLALR